MTDTSDNAHRPSKPLDDGVRTCAFWSPCHRYLFTVFVTDADISVTDDNGVLYEQAGDEQVFSDERPAVEIPPLTSHPCDDGLRSVQCPSCLGKGCDWCNEGQQLRLAVPQMTREHAIEIAQRCAKAKPQSYYAEPFQPHEWVIDAIMCAGNKPTPDETECNHPASTAVMAWKCDLCSELRESAAETSDSVHVALNVAEQAVSILRRLLAFAYSGAENLYTDDGELQDGSEVPVIDYVRDPVTLIEQKIQQRGLRKLASAAKANPPQLGDPHPPSCACWE